MRKLIRTVLKNPEFRNSGWLVGGKATQMMLSFIVGLWTARYLGPSNYGLLSYVSAYTAFFSALCTLGITSSVLVSELTKYPDEEGTTLGSTIVLRLLASFVSGVMIVVLVSFVDAQNPIVLHIAILSSIGIVFQVFDVIEYWFLKRYMSKITAIASLIGYCAASAYRILLLVNGMSVIYFAIATSIDYVAIAIVLFLVYKKKRGPKFKFSFQRSKEILSNSYHFILSGLMVAVYGQTDKMMLKLMLSEADAGYYATASSLSTMWVFVLTAIISSLSPTIVKLKKDGKEKEYCKKNSQLYGLVFYISIGVSIVISLLAPFIVNMLYGEAYAGSIGPLRVITWYVAFSYIGVARDIWLVCEKKQKYSTYMYIIAAFANVALNLILIPKCGATGAAIASLITQMLTSIFIPLLWKDMRVNVKLIFTGLTPSFWIKRA